MSYTPTEWENGDLITATKLNKMESGIANAGNALIVTLTVTNPGYVMDKTYTEIYETFKSGIPCYVKLISSTDDPITDQYVIKEMIEPIIFVYKYDENYRVYAAGATSHYISNMTLGLPVVDVFEATAPAAFPTFLRRVSVDYRYVAIDNNMV